MSDRANALDDETMRFGLLMEGAQAHQRLAESHLQRLRAHTQDLDQVVRDEIRRTLVDELKSLTTETDRAAQSLKNMRRAATLRGAAWSVGVALVCAAIPTAVAELMLPSSAEIAVLRTQREALARSVAQLEQRGGRADWRRCGTAARLCVRVDRQAPVYGEKADYYVVRGY
jgi:hypothetical protein